MENMEQAKPPATPKPGNRTILYAIIVIVLVVVGVGVYYLTRPSTTTTTTGPQVSIQDDGTCGLNDARCNFSPATIAATANGTAVTWTITANPSAPHTVHACVASNISTDGVAQSTACPNGLNANADPFASTTLRSGGTTTYNHIFTHTGMYYYYCSVHPWMHGAVNVTA